VVVFALHDVARSGILNPLVVCTVWFRAQGGLHAGFCPEFLVLFQFFCLLIFGSVN